MASRATWRKVPGAPRSRLGWLVREGPRWAIFFARKALLAIVLLSFFALASGATATFVFSSLAFLAVAGIAFPKEPEGPTFAEPSPCAVYVGRVEVWRDALRLGDDQVIATLSDGWLLVEGLRTTFALRSDDVEEAVRNRSATVLWLLDGTELRFHVGMKMRAGGERPLSLRDYEGCVRFRGFDGDLRDWRRGEVAVGESTLPPDQPHPTAVSRPTADLVMATFGTCGVIVTASTLGLWWALASLFFVPGPGLFRGAVSLFRLRGLGMRR